MYDIYRKYFFKIPTYRFLFFFFFKKRCRCNAKACTSHVQAKSKLLNSRQNMKDRMKICEGIKMVKFIKLSTAADCNSLLTTTVEGRRVNEWMNLQVHWYQKDYCYPINQGWLRRFGLWFEIVNKNVDAKFFPPSCSELPSRATTLHLGSKLIYWSSAIIS